MTAADSAAANRAEANLARSRDCLKRHQAMAHRGQRKHWVVPLPEKGSTAAATEEVDWVGVALVEAMVRCCTTEDGKKTTFA